MKFCVPVFCPTRRECWRTNHPFWNIRGIRITWIPIKPPGRRSGDSLEGIVACVSPNKFMYKEKLTVNDDAWTSINECWVMLNVFVWKPERCEFFNPIYSLISLSPGRVFVEKCRRMSNGTLVWCWWRDGWRVTDCQWFLPELERL